MDRKQFAERISSGLAGWFQQLAAQDLHLEVGEEAARVELVRMISAQRAFVPATAKRPVNWPSNDTRRIDIAVLGRREGATGWYGAIEVKWPGTSNDVSALRMDMVQDVLRVAFSNTANMNARFLVLGGSDAAIDRVFQKPHTPNTHNEARRIALGHLLSRSLASPDGKLTNAKLLENFPEALGRLSPQVTSGWNRRVSTRLVASAEARIGQDVKGHVFVWQCQR